MKNKNLPNESPLEKNLWVLVRFYMNVLIRYVFKRIHIFSACNETLHLRSTSQWTGN